MDGTELDNIYILYDSAIENLESLEKFKLILGHAGFNPTSLICKSIEEYLTELSENKPFYNYMICLNQTYKQINQVYSEKLDVPIFDFFSKEYVHNTKKLVLYGLLLSVEAIHEVAYKKYAWSVVQKFHKEVSELSQGILDIENDPCDYLNEPVEKNTDIPVIVEPQVSSPTEELVSCNNVVDIVSPPLLHPPLSPSYEELLSFYNNTKVFINTFQNLQAQLKSIEVNNEKV